MYLLTRYVQVRPLQRFSYPGPKNYARSRVPGPFNIHRTGPVILHTRHAICVMARESAMRLVRQGGAGTLVFPARPCVAGYFVRVDFSRNTRYLGIPSIILRVMELILKIRYADAPHDPVVPVLWLKKREI
jgi:hypothetical protein